MTRTVISRLFIALHVVAALALSAVAAKMLVLSFAVLGEFHDLCSNIPFVRSVPSGLAPDVSVAGLHDLASFAAFPGAPALLVLGIYVSCLEANCCRAVARPETCAGLPALGMLWSTAAAVVWMWALETVRAQGGSASPVSVTSAMLFTLGVTSLLAIMVGKANQPTPALKAAGLEAFADRGASEKAVDDFRLRGNAA